MENDAKSILEAIADGCVKPKICLMCGRTYTEAGNLSLSCLTHPGELIRDIGDPGFAVWSCCVATARFGAPPGVPCTASAHRSDSASGRAHPTIVVARDEVDTARIEAHGGFVVKSARDLERARASLGDSLAKAPWYGAVARYVGEYVTQSEGYNYYFPDESGAMGDEPAIGTQKTLTVIVARSMHTTARGAQRSGTRDKLLRLVTANKAHIVELIASHSPDPLTADTAQSIVVAHEAK